MDDDDDEEEDTKPEFESASLKHFGSVNRIRVSKSRVNPQIKDKSYYSQQLFMIVK